MLFTIWLAMLPFYFHKCIRAVVEYLRDVHSRITSRTTVLLQVLDLDESFLSTSVQSWEENDAYKASKQRVSQLAVVNDHAERAITLIKEFNSALTTTEEQRQFLLKAVHGNRKLIQKKTKKEIMI